MSFREIQFPPKYSRSSKPIGGDEFATRILGNNKSGVTDRIIQRNFAVARFDVSHMLKRLPDMIFLQKFMLAVGHGQAYGFRFKWWNDFCADQIDWKNAVAISSGSSSPTNVSTLPLIGTGDSITGSDGTAAFQLKKIYTIDSYSYERTIYKPVGPTAKDVEGNTLPNTVRIWVAGDEKTITTHFTVDYTTGVVTFTSGNHPTTGQAIRAWFEYDFPVVFAKDYIPLAVRGFDHTDIDNIELTEDTTVRYS